MPTWSPEHFSDTRLSYAFDALLRGEHIDKGGITPRGLQLLFALAGVLAETVEDPTLMPALSLVLELATCATLRADAPAVLHQDDVKAAKAPVRAGRREVSSGWFSR